MGWNNLIIGYHALHSVTKSYVNIFNAISTFFEPSPPTNIIINYTILNQYIIKQWRNVFGKKGESAVWKELQQFHDRIVVDPKKPQDIRYEQQRNSLGIPNVPKT